MKKSNVRIKKKAEESKSKTARPVPLAKKPANVPPYSLVPSCFFALPATQLKVAVGLCSFAHRETRCCIVRLGVLAERLKLSKRCIQESVRSLVDAGYIVKTERETDYGSQLANEYDLSPAFEISGVKVASREPEPESEHETDTLAPGFENAPGWMPHHTKEHQRVHGGAPRITGDLPQENDLQEHHTPLSPPTGGAERTGPSTSGVSHADRSGAISQSEEVWQEGASAPDRGSVVAKKERGPRHRFEPEVLGHVPDGVDSETWEEFVHYRNSIRKPVSMQRANEIHEDLAEIVEVYGQDPQEVMEQSITGGYIGVYPVRN